MIRHPDLSIVVPVRNERECLRPLCDETAAALATAPFTWELILVDDGSTDGSQSVIRQLAAERIWVRALILDRNHGQTAALDAGWRRADGRYLASMDADLQNDPADLITLWRRLQGNGDAPDMVAGVRTRRRDSLWKKIQSRIGNAVRNWITQDHITDTGCSLKMMKRQCLDRVTLFRGMHRFLPTLVRMQGYTVVELPVGHRPRRFGETKYGVLDRAWRGLIDCIAIRWMKSRLPAYRVEEKR